MIPAVGSVERAVAAAKLTSAEAALANGKTGIQVHGGMGYTWEVDAHLFLKRAYALEPRSAPATTGPTAWPTCSTPPSDPPRPVVSVPPSFLLTDRARIGPVRLQEARNVGRSPFGALVPH
jgi:hypothetical protein